MTNQTEYRRRVRNWRDDNQTWCGAVAPCLVIPYRVNPSFSFGPAGESFNQSFFTVQAEQVNGGATLCSQADYLFSLEDEVLRPDLRPRVEQWAELSGLRVEGREVVASLAAVATPAGEGQIFYFGRAAMFLRYYMIHLMREEGDLQREDNTRNGSLLAR